MIRATKIYVFVCAILICDAQARSVKSRKRYNSVISRFRGCGSRMTDALRFMCQSEMWKPDTCKEAKKIFCRNRSFSTHPICHFNCNSAASIHNLNVDFSNDDVIVTKTGPGNGISSDDVQTMFQYFFDRSKQGGRTAKAQKRWIRRSERNGCCRSSCSIDVLADLCDSSS